MNNKNSKNSKNKYDNFINTTRQRTSTYKRDRVIEEFYSDKSRYKKYLKKNGIIKKTLHKTKPFDII